MKTIIMLAMATVITTQAQAQSSRKSLEIPQRASETDLRISKEMSKTLTLENGIRVRYVEKKELDRAVDKLGGKATIYFNRDNQVPVDDKSKSGGVYVGSGADGLVATTNADSSAPVVVHPPLVPHMSISVVGGEDRFCVSIVPKNVDGSFVFLGAKQVGCNVPGSPVRVRQAGTYFVQVGNQQGRNFIELSEGENKIIPMRTIEIPATNVKKIQFRLYEDFESSQSQRELMMLDQYTLGRALSWACGDHGQDCSYLQKIHDFDSFRKEAFRYKSDSMDPQNSTFAEMKIRTLGDSWNVLASQYFYDDKFSHNDETNPGRDARDGEIRDPSKQKPYTYYVLPGVYGVRWMIDNSPDVTKNIQVQ